MFGPIAIVALLAADANKPHMNKGVNTPFAAKKQEVKLSGGDEKTLAAGKPVMRQTVDTSGKGGRALAVMDIAAEPETVCSQTQLRLGRQPVR